MLSIVRGMKDGMDNNIAVKEEQERITWNS